MWQIIDSFTVAGAALALSKLAGCTSFPFHPKHYCEGHLKQGAKTKAKDYLCQVMLRITVG
jgi:hypothetical protein